MSVNARMGVRVAEQGAGDEAFRHDDGRRLRRPSVTEPRTPLTLEAVPSPSLVAPVVGAYALVFAPDGRAVYFTAPLGGQVSTYRLSIDGGTPEPVGALISRAGISSDGGRLAGVYRETERAPLELGIVSVTGTRQQSFPGVNFASGGAAVQWDAKGEAVLYVTAERMNIWRQPLAGDPPQKLTNFSDLAVTRFAVSPDGRSIALSRGAVTRDAFIVTNFR